MKGICRHTIVLFLCAGLWNTASAPMSNAVAAGPGETCGTAAGIECGGKTWCQHEPNTCGVTDTAGICVKVPEICTQQYLPVCGCDGKTYGNDCARRSQKAQKRHDGPC